jgi:hypothetical protein
MAALLLNCDNTNVTGGFRLDIDQMQFFLFGNWWFFRHSGCGAGGIKWDFLPNQSALIWVVCKEGPKYRMILMNVCGNSGRRGGFLKPI